MRHNQALNTPPGSLIARYLEKHPNRDSFSLGIGGRSLQKLQSLSQAHSFSPDVAIFAFNITQFEEVNDVVRKAKIVINCIGPFWKYSTPIVRYVDTSSDLLGKV